MLVEVMLAGDKCKFLMFSWYYYYQCTTTVVDLMLCSEFRYLCVFCCFIEDNELD